jgi:hypothetical protein
MLTSCVPKFDRRMLPIVCTLYVLSYLDRGNIGNAKTAGAEDDLGLDSAQGSPPILKHGNKNPTTAFTDHGHQWTWVLNTFYIYLRLFRADCATLETTACPPLRGLSLPRVSAMHRHHHNQD